MYRQYISCVASPSPPLTHTQSTMSLIAHDIAGAHAPVIDNDVKRETDHTDMPVLTEFPDDERMGKRIVRKLDLLIVPLTAVLYLAAS